MIRISLQVIILRSFVMKYQDMTDESIVERLLCGGNVLKIRKAENELV